jgi:hypothetical protein
LEIMSGKFIKYKSKQLFDEIARIAKKINSNPELIYNKY